MRIRSYRTVQNEIDGLAITFVDVTQLKQAEVLAQEAHAHAESIVQTVREPLVVLDAELGVVSANQAFYRVFQESPSTVEHRYLYELGNGQWNSPGLHELLENILPHNGVFQDFEIVHDFPISGGRSCSSTPVASPGLWDCPGLSSWPWRMPPPREATARHDPHGSRGSAGRPTASKEREAAMPDRRAGPQLTMLRQRAEDFLLMTDQDIRAMPVQDVQQLVHELLVYQIELEMQNEELRRTQQELATARDRYSVLHDFTPAGYLALDRAGMILEANLTAARLLGIARGELLCQRLTDFIVPADQDTFYRQRQQVVVTHVPQTCELAMQHQDGIAFFVRLESLVELEDAGKPLRWNRALSDINARPRPRLLVIGSYDPPGRADFFSLFKF
jgi:PAS domain S-box-containing protein